MQIQNQILTFQLKFDLNYALKLDPINININFNTSDPFSFKIFNISLNDLVTVPITENFRKSLQEAKAISAPGINNGTPSGIDNWISFVSCANDKYSPNMPVVVFIGKAALIHFLENEVLNRFACLQTIDVMYNKIEISCFYKKQPENILIEYFCTDYYTYKFDYYNEYIDRYIDGPLSGHLYFVLYPGNFAIDLYPGRLSDTMPNGIYCDDYNQYEPNRYTIIGCGYTAEDVFNPDLNVVNSVLQFFKNGCYIMPDEGWYFKPVLVVQDEIRTVRAAQSAGLKNDTIHKHKKNDRPLYLESFVPFLQENDKQGDQPYIIDQHGKRLNERERPLNTKY